MSLKVQRRVTSHSGESDDITPWGEGSSVAVGCAGMTNFAPWREAGQRGDGKFIVLVAFKCDQCFGFQGRAQETKNN